MTLIDAFAVSGLLVMGIIKPIVEGQLRLSFWKRGRRRRDRRGRGRRQTPHTEARIRRKK